MLGTCAIPAMVGGAHGHDPGKSYRPFGMNRFFTHGASRTMMFRLIKMKKDTQKLSEILMKMAQTALINPDKDPSSEAASAALLFASTAWNVAVGQKMDIALCKAAIRQFEECNPAFWANLRARSGKKPY